MRALTLGANGTPAGTETVTVTPTPCQTYAFGPNGTSGITSLDWAKYYLCEMYEDVKGAGSWVSNELVQLWDWLWGGVQNLWNQAQQAAGQIGQSIQSAANSLWQGVQDLWSRVQQEWTTLTNWTKVIAIAAAFGIGYYFTRKFDK